MKNPIFHIYVGPMFAQKTTKLLSHLERIKYQKESYVVFKPKFDSRYSESEIVSHSGWKFPATLVEKGSDILGHLAECDSDPHYVIVDEAFMIPGVAESLTWLYRYGFNVIVSTLDLTYNGKPFKEIEQMLPWATVVEKCTAVCTVCGNDARYTYRKTDDEEQIIVGGSEMYEPRCHMHHPIINTREQ